MAGFRVQERHAIENVHRGRDGGQRVSQFMAEHREKRVLAEVCRLCFRSRLMGGRQHALLVCDQRGDGHGHHRDRAHECLKQDEAVDRHRHG